MTLRRVAEQFTAAASSFDEMAKAVHAYQLRCCSVYRRYVAELDADSDQIQYLPVEAFKLAPVTTFPPEEAAVVFESSGTGRGTPSRHYVKDLEVYRRSIGVHFSTFFGNGPFTIAVHLPHYAERKRPSSLLFMVEHLVERFGNPASRYFLDDYSPFEDAIAHAVGNKTPFILFGAAFGLLRLVETREWQLPADALVIETGGMKTYRREIGRSELHERLAAGFSLERRRIRSEYGMCELLSQCYTRGGEAFYPPPWMGFEVIDQNNPRSILGEGEAGALALFDIANMYSASAILTEDRAIRRGDGFELVGRITGAALRGCNFLLQANQHD